MNEYIGTIFCLILSVFTLLICLIFTVFKGKASRFISGFSSYSAKERELYDINKMSKDMAVLYLQLTWIMIIGVLISLLNQWFTILVGIIWFIKFFKNVHFDDEKAFGKYRK